jgi:hypothetical protein
MNDHGRARVVLDTGSMTRGSGSKNEDKERNNRKWFVERDLIEGHHPPARKPVLQHHRRRPERRAV